MAARPALRLQPEEPAPDSWKRFFVILTGRTNGVHKSVVKHFKSLGQTEVTSPGDADYCLVFCPVVSRVGTNVSEAMDHLLPGKEAVLVVMHQTFNREQVIPRSSRLVADQRVRLTLDCLFHQDKLLQCEINNNMKTKIKTFLNVSRSKTVRRLIVRFFLVLSSSLLYMLDSFAAALLFFLVKTGLSRQPQRHSDLSSFRRMIIFILVTVVVFIIYFYFFNDTQRITEDRPGGQKQEGRRLRPLEDQSY